MQVNNPLNLLDGFEIRRKGDENVHVRILLTLDYSPERFKVAAPLARLLGITAPESKAGLVHKLWQYIKTQKLLDAEDKRVINLDDELQQVGFSLLFFVVDRCLTSDFSDLFRASNHVPANP
jgi:chromatin remodeling complex protein RSC6